MKLENQYSNQWYEALARDLKSGAKAPEKPPAPVSAAAVSTPEPAPIITPIDFTDDFADDGFVDTIETPVEPEPDTKSKKKSKKKKKSDPLTNVILALSICVFLGSAGYLAYNFIIEPMLLNNRISNIAGDDEGRSKSTDNGIWESDGSNKDDSRNAEGILTWFEPKLAQNPDTVGWIEVPGTPINYPVTQTTDNSYYLTHTFEKEYNAAGNPFLDYHNVVGPNGQLSQCSIIYAHHRRNGTMFAKLKNYNDVEFYKQNAVITFDTIYDRNDWVVFANFRATTSTSTGKIFNYMKYDFDDDESFLNFVTSIRKRSYFNTPVEVNADDQILLLSTCSYEKANWRMVIAARKVHDGETIDVTTAEKNPAPLMP